MKQLYFSILAVLLFACNGEVKTNDTVVSNHGGNDTIEVQYNSGGIAPDAWKSELGEGTYAEDDFRALFAYEFPKAVDFGWRYITANYEEFSEDKTLTKTPYDEIANMEGTKVVKAVDDGSVADVEINIPFIGYAHSFRNYGTKTLFITYQMKEISQVFQYYFVDENFVVLDEGELSSNGGDEGSWSYSYGTFSDDYTVYERQFAFGEGLDTFDYGTDIIYFE